MEIRHCNKGFFDQILNTLPRFWGDRTDYISPMHHPTLIYEFGDTSFIAVENGEVLAYLFGFMAQTGPVGYIHLTAVRNDRRKTGLGRKLHQAFATEARSRHCRSIRAITTPDNTVSIAFHTKMGMRLIGVANRDGIMVVRNYSGPGRHRVVFVQEL